MLIAMDGRRGPGSASPALLLVKGARCGFRVRKEVCMEKNRWDRLHAHYKELTLERKSEQGQMPAFCLMDIKIVEI